MLSVLEAIISGEMDVGHSMLKVKLSSMPTQPCHSAHIRVWRRVALFIAVAMWLFALATPVWDTRTGSGQWDVVKGLPIALTGFLGILVLCPAWFANILFIPMYFTLSGSRKSGFTISIVAFALAATAYMMPALYGMREAAVIVGRNIGFYLWLGSFLVMAIGHAPPGDDVPQRDIRLRWLLILLMLLSIPILELVRPVGVSRLEAALKEPGNTTALKQGLKQNPSQLDKNVALWWALRQDPRDAAGRADMLVKAGADINYADGQTGLTPLMLSLWAPNNEAVVDQLLRTGADVNLKDRMGFTPLMLAVLQNSDSVIEKLLAAGSEVDVINPSNGISLIETARQNRRSPRVIELLEKAAEQQKAKLP